ncbi:acylglycerol kinase, mitochondrial-like isoform X2 [Paramacrobiotus metropolitanus]|uniref:acylglycerol kinase, mitochondrial-like isoform X2 n=1 Tax=Paramacrobiotus metropolitanus TaxID=2943436 RepID=UPI002445EBA8|nr:acylglycerol kinase, mitochondrial-like isoform X2 [Paramacrobiotus metropolitanus]
MAKIATTLWTHKKKAAVLFGAIAWGTNYGLEKRRIHEIMRSLCLEAKQFGDRPIPIGQQVRKAVVILNYGSHKSKARKLYENYAAPLLNLAGIQTTIYATDDTTKLREYLEHIEQTDAVIFAGGDDTVFECIQAYFKLDKPGLSSTPVGILPLGYSNAVYNALRPEKLEDVLKIAQAAMAAAKGACAASDVLEIKNGDNAEKDYAIVGLQWGSLRDVETVVPKYWYLGPFAPLFTYCLATVKRSLTSISTVLQYVNVCPGCSKCEQLVVTTTTITNAPRTWWQNIISRRKHDLAVPHSTLPQKFSDEVNEDCGIIHEDSLVTEDLHILTRNCTVPVHSDERYLYLTFRRPDIDTLWSKSKLRSRFLNEVNKLGDVEHYAKRTLQEVRILPKENDLVQHPKMEIDGRVVEIKGPLHVKLHPKKLFLFSPEVG